MKPSRLPPFIEIRESRIPGAGLGAFARADLPTGQKLGEYVGRHLTPAQYQRLKHNPYVWEVRDERDVPVLYLDAGRPRHGNWTRYVNCPRTRSEENLQVLQEGLRIYYQTKRPIRSGEELLIWYGPAYGEWLLGKAELE